MEEFEISFTDEQFFGSKAVILAGQSEQFEYVEGKKTENKIGVRLKICAPAKNFETFNVKIEGGKLLDLCDDDIKEACSSMKPIFIRLHGFKAKPYSPPTSSKVLYSCSATGVEIVNEEFDLLG